MAATATSYFFEQLRTCSKPALLLDYDGTLAPFVVDRAKAQPYPKVIELLRRIIDRENTRVVLVSGRTISDLASLLAHHRLGCEIWGVHGRQRCLRPGGEVVELQEPNENREPIAKAFELLSAEELGDRVERKPWSVAVHWRDCDPAEQARLRATAMRIFSRFVRSSKTRILEFDHGIELLMGDRDKGHVVRTILREQPSDAAVAYLGDDVTDEAAFQALRDSGLTVLVRPVYRQTAAQLWIKPPDGVVKFLQAWEAARGGKHERE